MRSINTRTAVSLLAPLLALLALLAPSLAPLLVSAALAQTSGSPIPSFEATVLTGQTVSSAQLIGQPTLLIVTPSKGAAEDTRLWVQALREHIDPKAIRIRDVLAVEVPFFMSEADVIGRAKAKIPQRYHDQTWITSGTRLEQALDIPVASAKAFVLVLNAQGGIVVRVAGDPTDERIQAVESAVRALVR